MSTESFDQSGSELAERLVEEVIVAREEGDLDRLLAGKSESELLVLRDHLELVAELDELAELLEGEVDETGPAPLKPDDMLGRYRILELIGEGGLSRVHRAEDTVLGRSVALKVLKGDVVEAEEAAKWLELEGRSLAHLSHESVVKVFDVGSEQGYSFVAMEVIDGPSLDSVLRALKFLENKSTEKEPSSDALLAANDLRSIADRCRLIARLARALEYCHRKGVIHRDVKASNVLVDSEGIPRLIDFGIAHLESAYGSNLLTQNLVGTPAYLSPEQIEKGALGASATSDQFSLGVLLYELLTLRQPFARKGTMETLAAVSRADPIPPQRVDAAIPIDLQRICLKSLARLPGHRYASIAALAADLEAFLDHRAISLRAPTPLQFARLWFARNKAQVLWVGSAVLVTLGILLVIWGVRQRGLRSALVGQFSEQTEALAGCEEPEQFMDLMSGVRSLQNEAEDLDAGLLAGLFNRPMLPEWKKLAGAVGRELREDLNAEVEAIEMAPDRVRRKNRLDAFFFDWVIVLWEAEQLSGEPVFGRRGTLELPTAGKLVRHKTHASEASISIFEPIEDWHSTTLEDGLYRYEILRDGKFLEAEFYTFAIQPAWKPSLIDFAAQPAPDMVSVQVGPELFNSAVFGEELSQTLKLRPFLLAERQVTWADLERVFDEDELAVLLERASVESPSSAGQAAQVLPAATDPANIPWMDAAEYAYRLGARLPTPLELWAAFEDRSIEAGREQLDREWVATTIGELKSCYGVSHEGLAKAPRFWLPEAQEIYDSQAVFGFRIAVTLPE